jgi:hypothetical protein
MRLFRLTLIILLLAFAVSPRPAEAQGEEAYILQQINALRATKRLPPLVMNGQLTAAAAHHSNYLASHLYTNPHREADGSMSQDRANTVGYTGRTGENVYGGHSATAQIAFDGWVQSPAHYYNMISPNWTEIGIAVGYGTCCGRWYTTVFGNSGLAPRATIDPNASPAPVRPRTTRIPPTKGPTATPTVTYTPSITYTPRPSFTPTDTPTGRPPTVTPIVLEISPQPAENAQPTITLTPELPTATFAETATETPVAVAMIESPPALDKPISNSAKSASNDILRTLIPVAIVLQLVIVGGMVVGSLRRRSRNHTRY